MTPNYSPAFIEHLRDHYRDVFLVMGKLRHDQKTIRLMLSFMRLVIAEATDTPEIEKRPVVDVYDKTIAHLDALWNWMQKEEELARLVQAVWNEYEDTSCNKEH